MNLCMEEGSDASCSFFRGDSLIFFFFFLVCLSLFGIVAIFVVKKILERGSFYIESRVTMFSNF